MSGKYVRLVENLRIINEEHESPDFEIEADVLIGDVTYAALRAFEGDDPAARKEAAKLMSPFYHGFLKSLEIEDVKELSSAIGQKFQNLKELNVFLLKHMDVMEFNYTFSITGSYRKATMWDPEENPEMDEILLNELTIKLHSGVEQGDDSDEDFLEPKDPSGEITITEFSNKLNAFFVKYAEDNLETDEWTWEAHDSRIDDYEAKKDDYMSSRYDP